MHKSKPVFLVLSLFQFGASLVAQKVKNLPAVQETQVCSMGREDSLKKGMATYSSILAWRIPWQEYRLHLPFSQVHMGHSPG